MQTMRITYLTDGGYTEVEATVPARFEVCDRCEGRGTHDHPAFSNGITSSDFDEDPDFREDYMRGAYDVSCSECRGLRVVAVPDVARCSFAVRRELVQARRYEREQARFAAIERREREMGY
jgi:hypothetical protein